MGDINICDPDEGRLNSRNLTFSDGDASRPAVLLAAFTRSMEIAQPYFTRKDERRIGSIQTLSRIDRIFMNLPMAGLRDFRCHCRTIGSVGDTSLRSDHTPVQLTIECPSIKQQGEPVIQRWLVQHPLFVSALNEEHRSTVYDDDPSVALEQCKEVTFKTRSKARQAILVCTSTTPGAKLLNACTTLRAYRSGSAAVVKECCGARAPVARCFDAQSCDCIYFSGAVQCC